MLILLIEDSPTFAASIKAMLRHSVDQPFTTATADTLAFGLKVLSEQPVDLVLLDLTLPDSEGLSTLRSVLERSDVPVVIISGIEDEKKAIEALKLGAQDYLLKDDITGRNLYRSVMYALERKKMQVLEAQRLRQLELREDFMATLTHDLKNPLIGSNRLLELVADGKSGNVPPDVRELLLRVCSSNNSLLTMIQTMIEVYRYEKDVDSLVKRQADLRGIIDSYVNSITPVIEAQGKALKAELPSRPKPVYADPGAIQRVLQNLIDNAVKFSPEGAPVELRLLDDSDKAIFEISDHGLGVADEDKERLFQRFGQGSTRTLYGGTGLGLYLCRQIVEAHNGNIWCESQFGQGATFGVSLPLLQC